MDIVILWEGSVSAISGNSISSISTHKNLVGKSRGTIFAGF
jgi:hypothetical protein